MARTPATTVIDNIFAVRRALGPEAIPADGNQRPVVARLRTAFAVVSCVN
jgi:hypothetical protein